MEGWCLGPDNLATRINDGGRNPGDDVLMVKDGAKKEDSKIYWVIPLDKPLEYCSPENIFNVDEKPFNPDNPIREHLNLTGISGELLPGL